MRIFPFIIIGLALLAGCATNPRPNTARVPNWESEPTHAAHLPAAQTNKPPVQSTHAIAVPVTPSVSVATNRITETETWVSLGRWAKSHAQPMPELLSTVPKPTYSLATGRGVFCLRAGSQAAQFDGIEVRLGFPPQAIDNQIFLHRLDVAKVLQPLAFAPPLLANNTNRLIVLDPGHGGDDSGARSIYDGRYEKEFTLDWARRLERLLITNNWQVLLTRPTDMDIALSNRVSFAERAGAALFISLHFNSSAPDESQAAGLETYCLTPTGERSTVARQFPDDPTLTFPNNNFDTENLQLALALQRAVLEVNGHLDRGVRRARFPTVLRGQRRPAALVEGGYLSNRREARQIDDPEYRQRLAGAIANALGKAPGTTAEQVEQMASSPASSDNHTNSVP